MPFTPRSYEEIRDDAIAFVRMNTTLTDFEIGSVIRTIIEAASLEDDEQYFQMVQLLDAFRLSTSSGQDLDDKVEEFGIIRLQAESSAGEISIRDRTLLIQDTLEFDVLVAATSIILEDSSAFPTSGFPYIARIGEGTLAVEDVSITSHVVPTNTLGISAGLENSHDAGDRVAFVSGAADKTFTPGIRVQVPAAGGDGAIIFITIESGTLVNGNFESTPINARAEIPGKDNNVGVGNITEFASSPPFDGAGVINLRNFAGGRDLETDAQLQDRAQDQIQSLTRGTVLSLSQGVLGVSDPVTGQRVTTANILESFVLNEVIVYVDDGTGFIPDLVGLASSVLTVVVAAPVGVVTVSDASDFPEEGWIIISPENAVQIELIAYSGVDYTTNVITLVGVTQNLHDISDEVALVDLVEDDAESGANFFQMANFPIVRASQRVWVAPTGSGTGFVLQAEGTDYELNRGTGQLELTGSGLVAESQVAANYSYYTGLVSTTQTVIDGDPGDPTNFPGIRAAGSRVVVETPVIRRITVSISITAAPGFQEADLTSSIQDVIEAYIDGLGIGEDVIVAEIIERSMAIDGMFDAVVTIPTSNITVLENELPVPFNASGSSLVTVT